MADDPHSRVDDRPDGFEQQAQQASKARSGPLREFRYFLGRTRNFWLVPVNRSGASGQLGRRRGWNRGRSAHLHPVLIGGPREFSNAPLLTALVVGKR